MKKLFALMLAAVMLLSLTVSASALNSKSGPDKVVLGTTTVYDTLDPFTSPQEFHCLVYETLGGREGFGGEFKGRLMKSWSQLDEKTYEIELYDTIYDSAGNHITADDVVFSFNEAFRIGKLTKIKVVDTVEKTGDYTVKFTWKATPVVGSFETVMSVCDIVSQAAYEASSNGMNTDPVGTGPYKLDSFTAGVSVTVVARDDYWQPAEAQTLSSQKQNIKYIELQTISETEQMATALTTGNVDMSKDVASQNIPAFQAASADFTVEDNEGWYGYVMYPNLSEGSPLVDINVRKAVFSAVYRDAIAMMIQAGACKPLYAMGATLLPDYNPEWANYMLPYDVNAAKQYLADAGYPNGITLKLIYPPIGYLNDTAQLLQNMLAPAGITLEIDMQQFGNYLGNEHDPSAWNFTMAPLSASDYCVAVMGAYFDQNQTGTGASKNFIVDAELQAKLEEALNPATFSNETVDAAWKYIAENCYALPLICPDIFYVYNSAKIESVVISGEGMMLPNAFIYK